MRKRGRRLPDKMRRDAAVHSGPAEGLGAGGFKEASQVGQAPGGVRVGMATGGTGEMTPEAGRQEEG